VPGLFVFTAGDYRVSIGLWRTAGLIVGLIALGIVGSWIGRLIQWLDANALGRVSLKPPNPARLWPLPGEASFGSAASRA
jgi:hypothetical protein